jgi:hypothetical protein
MSTMSEMRTALAWIFVGFLVLANSACEHKDCDEAMNICRADFGNQPKAAQTQVDSMDGLKTALARLQARVQWPSEAFGKPLARSASEVDRDGVGKTAKSHQDRVAKQAHGSNRT